MASKSKIAIIKDYFIRSSYYWKHQLMSVGAKSTWQKSQQWFTFSDLDDLNEFKIGCDADIGGHSRCYWGLTDRQTALFWGTISANADVAKLKSGYAGITSKWRPKTGLHQPGFDTRPFRYLEIEAKGDHHTWFVNLLTGEPGMPVKLWQQRIHFKTPGQFETIQLDFANFVRTVGNEVHPRAPKMNTVISQFGISILHQPGDFAMEIRSVRASNTIRTWGYTDKYLIDEYIDDDGKIRKGTVERLNHEHKNGADKDDKLEFKLGPFFKDPEQYEMDQKNKRDGKNDIFDDDLAKLAFGAKPNVEELNDNDSAKSIKNNKNNNEKK